MFGLCAAKHNLDVDTVRNGNPHELPEGTLVGIEIDEPLVDAHLPAIPGLASLSIGGFPAGDLQLLCGKGNRSADIDSGPLGDLLDLVTDSVDFGGVSSTEGDSCTL